MSDLKKFFERDSVRGTITARELLEFKHSCTAQEYDSYVEQAKASNEALVAA